MERPTLTSTLLAVAMAHAAGVSLAKFSSVIIFVLPSFIGLRR